MKFEVTRDVVNDLWPLYRCGEASTDSRQLVDSFLETDSEFAKHLRASDPVASALPPCRLSPDAELRLLNEARDRARWRMFLTGGVFALVALTLLGALSLALFRLSG